MDRRRAGEGRLLKDIIDVTNLDLRTRLGHALAMTLPRPRPDDGWVWNDERWTDLEWEVQIEEWTEQLMDDALLSSIGIHN